MTPLEKELYDFANKYIGNVCPSTDGYNAVTGELYTEYATKTDAPNRILDIWTRWIKAYALFQQSAIPLYDDVSVERNPKLYIYWQIKPEIKEQNGMTYVYARLLISRCNYKNRSVVSRIINNDC